MAGLIWIASYPKSGNTWMRVFLANLLLRAEQPVDINEVRKISLADTYGDLWRHFVSKPLEQLTDQDLAAVRPRMHQALAEQNRMPVLLKTHNAQLAVADVPLITWSCSLGAIYILRDPLDVAVSFAAHYGQTLDHAIETMGRDGCTVRSSERHVTSYIHSWSGNVASWTAKSNPRILVLRYEDILARPEEIFPLVARVLNIKRSDAEIERAMRFSSFEEVSRQEREKGFVETSQIGKTPFFRAGKAGEGRELLSAKQQQALVERHREQMERFGYLPAGVA
jgi:hypothetical protein